MYRFVYEKVPKDARGVGDPGAPVTGDSELLTWVLGAEPRTCVRATSDLNGGAVSPGSWLSLLPSGVPSLSVIWSGTH